MLVVDASAVCELLLSTADGRAVAREIAGHDLIALAHLPAEVASVVRGLTLGGHLDDASARTALRELWELGLEMLPLDDLIEPAWEARHNLSAYDALYVVLARQLVCPLVTLDRRLAAAAPDCAVLPAS